MRGSDLTGQLFGRLTVVRRAGSNRHRHSTWLCSCSCGSTIIADRCNLIAGGTRSCGCLARELTIARSTKHGHSPASGESREYAAWQQMWARCAAPEGDRRHAYYAARGIRVCRRWRSFTNFLADMGAHPGEGYSLDRINNDKGYSRSNCRWATWSEQSKNRRQPTTRVRDARGRYAGE